MPIQQKVNFLGLDTDTELRFMEPGSYRYALNVHVGSSEKGNLGAVENIKGNTLVTIALPSGYNRVIGAHEDRLSNAIYYFLYNRREHALTVSTCSNSSGEITVTTTTNHGLTNGDWITISGVAGNTGANGTWQVEVGIGSSVDTKFALMGSVRNGTYTGGGTITTYSHGVYKFDISNNSITKIFEWSGLRFDENYLITGTAFINNQLYWTDNQMPQRQLDVVKCLSYPTQYIEAYIDFVKIPPVKPIVCTASNNPALLVNYLRREQSFEFIYQYVYVNNEKSRWSPISKPVTVHNLEYLIETGGLNYNEITLDLSNNETTDVGGILAITSNRYSNLILKINIAVRTSFTAPFRLIGTVPFPTTSFTFRNDGSYSAIATIETEVLYDSIPVLSKSLTLIKNRIFLGWNTEDFSNPTIAVSLYDTAYDSVSSLPTTNWYNWKYGGKYQLGVAYYDRAGRTSGVITDPLLLFEIKFAGDDSDYKNGKVADIGFHLTSAPPIWATHYQIVRSNNLTCSEFINASVNDVKYCNSYTGTTPNYFTPTLGGGGTIGDTLEIHFDIKNFNGRTAQNIDNETYYTFTDGDYISVIYNCISNSATITNKRIANYKIDKILDNRYLVVKYDHTTMDSDILKPGAFVEIFTPYNTSLGNVYFEMGEYHGISRPGTVNRSHTAIDLTFGIQNGDVTSSLKTFSADTAGFVIWFQNMNPSRRKQAGDWYHGDGRPNVVIPDARQVDKKSAIRFSNLYISGSKINGLSSFEGLNETILPAEFGGIYKLIVASNTEVLSEVLLSIHEREVVTNYIDQTVFSDLAGQNTIALSDKVMPQSKPMRGSYGTVNPESVCQIDGNVFGWDLNKGVVWQAGQNGLLPISGDPEKFPSGRMKNFFFRKSQELIINKSSVVAYGCIDMYSGEYILTIWDKTSPYLGETLSFNYTQNRWASWYGFTPEYYQKINNHFVSFKNGQLYLHGTNTEYNKFYDPTIEKSQVDTDYPIAYTSYTDAYAILPDSDVTAKAVEVAGLYTITTGSPSYENYIALANAAYEMAVLAAQKAVDIPSMFFSYFAIDASYSTLYFDSLKAANAYNNKSKITAVLNQDPSKQKILLTTSTESKDVWYAQSITSQEGQQSSLVEADYKKIANAWCANVLRDENTPNIVSPKIPILHGDTMKSGVFEVVLQNDKTTLSPLYFVNFYYVNSERSNK